MLSQIWDISVFTHLLAVKMYFIPMFDIFIIHYFYIHFVQLQYLSHQLNPPWIRFNQVSSLPTDGCPIHFIFLFGFFPNQISSSPPLAKAVCGNLGAVIPFPFNVIFWI